MIHFKHSLIAIPNTSLGSSYPISDLPKMAGGLVSNSIIPTPSRFYHSSTDNPRTLA